MSLSEFMKIEDLEWLGFNWFKVRIGYKILNYETNNQRCAVFFEMID